MEGLDPCFYCGKELVPPSSDHPHNEQCLDHLIPRSRGGQGTPDNLVSSCRACNTAKGTKNLEEFRAYRALQRDPDYELRGSILKELLAIAAFGPLRDDQKDDLMNICNDLRATQRKIASFAGELRVN
jgi:hypothetical protein